MDERRKIVMENGLEMLGRGFGANVDAVNEIVFNTAMAGYQEIVTDPSYTAQAVVMTYPLIGNYGITDEDYETKTPTLGGMIVREYNDMPSNFRYTKTLSEILEENGIPGIQGVDTRRLTRVIRDEGSQKVLITDADTPHEEAMERLNGYVMPTDQVSRVSCKKKWYARTAGHRGPAALAALAAVYYAEGRMGSAADHRPEYLRPSQAERVKAESEGM